MTTKRLQSRSDSQCAAELAAIQCFAREQGITLAPRELNIENCKVNVDGYSVSEDGLVVVIAEAWAHVGKAIGSQPKKVATDVLKMAFVADYIQRTKPGCVIKMYMVFIDGTAARSMSTTCWVGAAAKRFGVIPCVVSIDQTLANAVSLAQVSQNLMSAE